MTQTLTQEVRRQRLLGLADLIERQPECPDPNRFGGGFTMRRYSHDVACDSLACVAGWATHLYGHLSATNRMLGIPNGFLADMIAADVLSLEPVEADMLFKPSGETAHFEASYGSLGWISPQRAARTLCHLAETGVVDWDAPVDVGPEVVAVEEAREDGYREKVGA